MNTMNGTTNAESGWTRAAAGLGILEVSPSAGPGPISHMLAELSWVLISTTCPLPTIPCNSSPPLVLPFTTRFESEAGQRHIFHSLDMGYARPPVLSADFSYTGEGFAAFFEIRFDNSSWAFDGGDWAVPSGGVLSELGGIPLFS